MNEKHLFLCKSPESNRLNTLEITEYLHAIVRVLKLLVVYVKEYDLVNDVIVFFLF